MPVRKDSADGAQRKRPETASGRITDKVDPSSQGGVHVTVVDAIGRWILGGVYDPGDLLPREDDLAEKLGVSRTSVREAVKVLSAKGLLQARRRVGVRVRARDEWNLLDPLVLSWHPDVGRDKSLIDSLIEARRIIEPEAAALAAIRATADDLARIEEAYLGMERNVRTDLEACCEADLRFHTSSHGSESQRGPQGSYGNHRGGPSSDLQDYESSHDCPVTRFGGA